MWMAIVFNSLVAITKRERLFEANLNPRQAVNGALVSLIGTFTHAAAA